MTRPHVLLPVVALLALLSLVGCGLIPGAQPAVSSAPAIPTSVPAVTPADDQCEYTPTGSAAKPVDPPPGNNVATSGTVKYALELEAGTVVLTLDRAKAPCTVNSFVSLAEQHYFDGSPCHRLADSGIFVLQCGDPTGTGKGGPGYQFANETEGNEKYVRGVVAMANAGPGTNGSQFFLVWEDSSSLDKTPNYTIFGRMDPTSRDVIASIAAQGQDGRYGDGTGVPNAPAVITSVARA